jgi:hypothetical protein
MKKIMLALALHTLVITALNAQTVTEQKIDKAMKDPKTEERSSKADALLFDKTIITPDSLEAPAVRQKAAKKGCRKKKHTGN